MKKIRKFFYGIKLDIEIFWDMIRGRGYYTISSEFLECGYTLKEGMRVIVEKCHNSYRDEVYPWLNPYEIPISETFIILEIRYWHRSENWALMKLGKPTITTK